MKYNDEIKKLKSVSNLYNSRFDQNRAIYTQSNPFTQSLFGKNSGISLGINYARIGVGELNCIDFLPISFGSTHWSRGLEIEMLDTQREEHIKLEQYVSRDSFDLIGLPIPINIPYYEAILKSINYDEKSASSQYEMIVDNVGLTLELLQSKRFERLDKVLRNLELGLEFTPDSISENDWGNLKMSWN